MKPGFIGLCGLLVCSVVAVGDSARMLRFEALLRCGYDRNVFHYSAQDESLFRYRVQPERFPFRSLDDAVVTLEGRMQFRPVLIRRHTTHLNLSIQGHQYVSNPVKSYFSARIGLRQYFSRRLDVEAGYLVIPRYLIRYYRDPDDPGGYRACAFTEQRFDLGFGLRPKVGVELRPFARFELNDYPAPFEFYRTRAARAGLSAGVRAGRYMSIAADYEYKDARTRHVRPDLSYRQHEASILLNSRCGKLEFGLGACYSYRGYTASPETDSAHAGRVDVTRALQGRARLRLRPGLTLEAELEPVWRDAVSPYKTDIDDVKNYRTWTASVGVRYGEGR